MNQLFADRPVVPAQAGEFERRSGDIRDVRRPTDPAFTRDRSSEA